MRRSPWCASLLAAALAFTACDNNSSDADRPAAPTPPGTFFAVRHHSTRIVEVDTASGEVRRTIVDLGYAEPAAGDDRNTYIDSIDIAPGRQALYYGVRPDFAGVAYRVALPDGKPERIADGHGVSVSPDGQRLAFISRTELVVRDLSTNTDQVFEGLLGELGGGTTAWAPDNRHLAFENEGADVFIVTILDTQTGQTVDLRPNSGGPDNYFAHSPRFRPTDGLLNVVCCIIPDVPPHNPAPSLDLVLHDPGTGQEKERSTLPFSAGQNDYDPSGTHQLLPAREGVYRRTDGQLTLIPDTADVDLVAR